MMSPTSLVALFVVAVVILLGALVAWAIAASRRQAAAQKERFQNLGFTLVQTPDPALVERIAAMRHKRSRGPVRLEKVFHRRGEDHDLYLVDIVTPGSDEGPSNTLQVVLVSSYLNLPAFATFPRVEGEGFLAAAANRVVTGLLARSMPLVEVTWHPGFARKYWLFAESAEEVRAALPEAVLDHLAESVGCAIEARGDTLLVGRLPQAGKGARSGAAALDESLRLAVALLALWRRN